MSLIVNLRHLAKHNLVLKGELPVSELDLAIRDDMIRPGPPLWHDLEVQQLDRSVLIRGRLRLVLHCQCVRCLKPFQYQLELAEWIRHLPLQGEERVPVVNDCVDLTPHVREDILLAIPQHPLCQPECRGLVETETGKTKTSRTGPSELKSSAWAELDRLEF